MGQYWKLINVDKRECGKHLGKVKEFLFSTDESEQLLSRLLRVRHQYFLPVTVEAMAKLRMSLSKHPREHVLGVLGRLPDELIVDIVSVLTWNSPLPDLICIALTCQQMWQMCMPHMEAKVQAIVATTKWYGDRIMCVGDYARQRGPAGVLTPAERTEIKEAGTDLYSFCEDRAFALFDVHERIHSPLDELHKDSCRVLQQLVISEPADLDDVSKLEHMILRNLSKHEYIRQDVLVALQKRGGMPFRLGDALMIRIGYSEDPTGAEDFYCGEWAGDRFDLVPAQLHEQNSENDTRRPWQDVSAEVIIDLMAFT